MVEMFYWLKMDWREQLFNLSKFKFFKNSLESSAFTLFSWWCPRILFVTLTDLSALPSEVAILTFQTYFVPCFEPLLIPNISLKLIVLNFKSRKFLLPRLKSKYLSNCSTQRGTDGLIWKPLKLIEKWLKRLVLCDLTLGQQKKMLKP